ncbi:hypothetical protein ACQZ6C_10655 [Rhizobium rhizogenes]
MPSSRTVPQWTKDRNVRGIKHGYRSGLEEKLGDQIRGEGEEVLFETFKVPYLIPESVHKYTPDFMLANGIIVEGKGIFDAQDRAKHLLIKAQHPGLDIRFVFSRSKASIGNGSKTTLADWCMKFGFKYADKLIPKAWFSEPGPQRHPLDIIKEVPSAGTVRRKAS